MIPDSLEELWLFGSAVTEDCRETSDIIGTPEGFLEEQAYKGSIYKQVQDKGF